jgi:hypothetical protein
MLCVNGHGGGGSCTLQQLPNTVLAFDFNYLPPGVMTTILANPVGEVLLSTVGTNVKMFR